MKPLMFLLDKLDSPMELHHANNFFSLTLSVSLHYSTNPSILSILIYTKHCTISTKHVAANNAMHEQALISTIIDIRLCWTCSCIILICHDAFSVNKNDAVSKLSSRRVMTRQLTRRETRSVETQPKFCSNAALLPDGCCMMW